MVLLAAPFLSQVDATIANVATPGIRDSLGASGGAAQLVIDGYLIAYAALLVSGARLGRSHGYKRLFMIGMSTFLIASLAAGVSPSVGALVGARVVQGAGAALMFPQAMTGIQTGFTGAVRDRAIGRYALSLSAGAVLGQLAGGLLVSANVFGWGWRVIFLINVPLCAVLLVAAARLLRASPARTREGVDLTGTALLSAGVLLVVLPLTLGRSQGWPAWAWACLAGGVMVTAVFLLEQRQASSSERPAVFDTRVLARPSVLLALATLSLATATYFALLFTVAQYEQAGLGRSAITSGLILVPWVAAFGLAGHVNRVAPAAIAARLPVIGGVLLTLAYLAISLTLFAGVASDADLAVLFALGGLGLGINFTTHIGHLMNAVPPGYAADISGVTSTVTQVFGALGVAGLGGLYLAASTSPGAGPAAHGFAVTALAFTIIAAATTSIAQVLYMHGRHGPNHVSAPADRGAATPAGSRTGR